MTFREVLGHRSEIAELRRAIERDALPHALLFTGRPGVGKRLVATALLQAKYCERSPPSEKGEKDGCGECPSCRRVVNRDHPDVEILERERGRRDIGIAAVRAVQDALHLSAQSRRGRSVLVDGAERLTEEAQNALLKTLEEPPRGSLIVLIASSADRLLPTIRSRCAIHRFAPLSEADVAQFGRMRGLDAAQVPPSVARGSPGAWIELSTEPNPEGRRAALALLLEPGESPFQQAARLVALSQLEVDDPRDAAAEAEDDDEPSDATETARRRLRTWLSLLELAIRDAILFAVAGDEALPRIAHRDMAMQLSELTGLTGLVGRGVGRAPIGDDALFAALDQLHRAQSDVERNVDRSLVLEELAIGFRARFSKSGSRAAPSSR